MSTSPTLADWVASSPSAAMGQRSLGDPALGFPLWPPLVAGCPATSTPDMQYPLDIDFDYARIAPSLFDQPPLPGLARWAPLLPPLAPGLPLGEGGTPLVEMRALSDWAGLDGALFVKDESRNPTWSHKDRLNLCVVSAALATDAPGIAVASSGNHGAAAAAYAARAGLPCVVITSRAAQPAFRHFLRALGAHVVLAETEERWVLLNRLVAATGFMPASNLTRFHTGHAFGPEGYKTIAYEIFLQLGRQVPGTVIVPTGYGEPKQQLLALLHVSAEFKVGPDPRGCAFANAAIELPDPNHPARRVIEEAKSRYRQLIAELCREAGLRDPELLADELFLLGEGARVAAQALGPRGPVQHLFEIFRSVVAGHTPEEN